MRDRPRTWAVLITAVGFAALAGAAAASDTSPTADLQETELARGFVSPPDSAKPHTWWHWMNGMVTKEGITADLESMKRVGIGGVQIFNVDQGSPAGPVPFMSDAWREMVRHAVAEAHRLGLEVRFQNCAGWSNSGGPWVTPEHAMLVVTTAEISVRGGAKFDGKLPRPRTTLGFYKDIAVLAFPTPGGRAEADTLRIQGLDGKAGYVRRDNLKPSKNVKTPADKVVSQAKIVDLTERLADGGRLTWQAPSGNWTVVRLGYTPIGRTNHPAPAAGRGLEVDKLSREAMDQFFSGMMQTVIDDNRELVGKTLAGGLIDSYEVGSQNWTPRLRDEFIRRRGYDPAPWLVTLTGRVVNNIAQSERFLWDYRRTIAELFDENYFGYFAELCHRNGLDASVEPYGNGLFNDVTAGAPFDVPMGEFWLDGGYMETNKLAASVAHTNGQKLVGAEAFTGMPMDARWQIDPYAIKALGDCAFCAGINRYVLHTCAMQPWLDKVPGMTMGPWGTRFGRTNTWWEQSTAWFQYVARCQYLLQQGQFVGDVCTYVGEDSPVGRHSRATALPAGYDGDLLSVELLLDKLSVRDGRLVLPSGVSYRVLVLPSTRLMTPRVAKKIRQLVAEGATVLGPKPTRSPSLSGYPACDQEVRRIADEVWADCDGKTVTEHAYGRGRVVWGKSVRQVLEEMDVLADFGSDVANEGRLLPYIHRRAGDTDLYFVSNQAFESRTVECTFRVAGRQPQLWHPDSGKIEPAAIWTATADGRTRMPLSLDPSGSVFVVFSASAAPSAHLAALERDGQSALAPEPAANAVKVVVTRAIYGVLDDPERCVDVTRQVRKQLGRRVVRVDANNDLAGDPAPNVVKQLRIDYAVDGTPRSATVREGQSIPFPDTTHVLCAPAAAYVDRDGSLKLLARRGGAYRATTAAGKSIEFDVPSPATPLELAGAWNVAFPPNLGAPASVTLPKLISWTDSDVEGVKHFSGTATYTRTINVPASLLSADRRVYLDLGRVKNLAQVIVNGRDLGILWKPPFAVDVTDMLKPGENQLEIRVTNLWPNRLIGDEQLPDDCTWQGDCLTGWPDWLVKGQPRPASRRVTFTTRKQWHRNDPLLESGLLGPVQLRQAIIVDRLR